MRSGHADIGFVCGSWWHEVVVKSTIIPGQFDMWKCSDVLRADVHPPQLNLVLQSSTITGRFDMWQNADVPQSVYSTPLVIKPSGTEYYYTRWVWHAEVFRCIEVRYTLPSIEPSATELYYTRSVWHVAECRCTTVRCIPLVITPSGTEPYYTRMQIYKNADIPRSDVPLVIEPSVP